MRKNLKETEFGSVWVERDIIHVSYRKGLDIDYNMAKAMVETRAAAQEYQTFPAFADSRGVKSFSKEARDYLADEGTYLLNAIAIVIESQVQKLMGNFFLQINKPKVPVKLFTDENEAYEWLNKYKS